MTQLRDATLRTVAASRIHDAVTGETVSPALLQFDPLTIMARAMAGLAYEEYAYLDWISLQATPYTATDEAALAWGALVGVTPKPATPAAGAAAFSGAAGAAIPRGTQLVRPDGVLYATTADQVIPAGGRVELAFEATTPGAATTLAAGAALALASPIAGVLDDGVVTASAAPGADIETADAFRARFLARFASPPHGGAAADYVNWALSVPGVTRAWVAASLMGPGTVGLYVMFDGSEAAGGGFPVGADGVSALDNDGRPRDALVARGDQALVADALVPLQPVTALVYVTAPVPFPVDFDLRDLGPANTGPNQAAVAAALRALFTTLGDPRGQTVYPSSWTAAIAGVLPRFTIAAPVAPVAVPRGRLPVVGQLSFTA